MIHTIEMDYEYQIAKAIRILVSEDNRTVKDFAPDELMNYIEANSARLGEIIAAGIFDWADEDHWHQVVSE